MQEIKEAGSAGPLQHPSMMFPRPCGLARICTKLGSVDRRQVAFMYKSKSNLY